MNTESSLPLSNNSNYVSGRQLSIFLNHSCCDDQDNNSTSKVDVLVLNQDQDVESQKQDTKTILRLPQVKTLSQDLLS